MIIKQPEDITLDRERINGILILLNNVNKVNGDDELTDSLRDTIYFANGIPGIKGTFSYQREDGVIFTAES